MLETKITELKPLKLFKLSNRRLLGSLLGIIIAIVVIYFGFYVSPFEYQNWIQYYAYVSYGLGFSILFLAILWYKFNESGGAQGKNFDKKEIFRNMAEKSYHPWLHYLGFFTMGINFILLCYSSGIFIYFYIMFVIAAVIWSRIIHKEVMNLIEDNMNNVTNDISSEKEEI